jgi:hypothetical protein
VSSEMEAVTLWSRLKASSGRPGGTRKEGRKAEGFAMVEQVSYETGRS